MEEQDDWFLVGTFIFSTLLLQIWANFMRYFLFFQDKSFLALGAYTPQLQVQIVVCRRLARFFFLKDSFVSFWSSGVLALSANCKSTGTDPAVFHQTHPPQQDHCRNRMISAVLQTAFSLSFEIQTSLKGYFFHSVLHSSVHFFQPLTLHLC